MFDLMKQAGITADELSRLIGVGRISVFNWKAGRTKPHKMLAERVEKVVALITKLVEEKKLPAQPEDRETRRARIVRLRAELDQK